ncbi:MAG TPA: TetR-like C-terminal domain-containing protein [Sphingomonas sp.]|uniref:TetR-like C-terminal domain-containing protein n=1 Tax=Sphingomonas sp. TaxID=28214 RepID=UPI002CD09B5C|nr:TetR-like C-terminal domain-containing protein [Sphingomonas sp.]HMI19708.1 TetR-like C-terminal domain-containing protein [Sphingomonas sp.]
MTALAEEGLKRLAAAQHEVADAAGGGEAGFAATGRAYVRFALANPALFRLIFTSPVIARYRQNNPAPNEAMNFLLANAAASVGAEQESAEARGAAIQAWAQVHGIAMLMLDGQLPVSDRIIDSIC